MSEEFKDVLEVWDEAGEESAPEFDFEIIEEEDWIDDGKYSFKSTYVKWKDAYYRIDQSRSGSYFTDYYYDDPTYVQVVPEQVVVTKTIWKAVK
jgi:hypothetical protein